MIRFEDVSIGYDRSQPLISSVSLAVQPGSRVGILGPNGVGKSTLLKTLIGIVPLISGEIRIEGTSLSAYSRQERTRLFSWMSQASPGFFHFTVEDIVLMGRYPFLNRWGEVCDADKAIVQSLLEGLGIGHLRTKWFHHLSSGEQQLVMLARTFAQESTWMILDEPFTHLDLYYQRSLARHVTGYCEDGKGFFLVSHSPELIQAICDFVILIGRDGRVGYYPISHLSSEAVIETLFGLG